MADDLQSGGRQDRLRINVNEPYEVRYWTKRLGCTEQALRDVVTKVGPMAADVELVFKPSP